MLSLTYIFVYLLQSTIKYSTSQTTRYNPFYWKTSAATEVEDYWNHGQVFLPGLQGIYTITAPTKHPDIFPPWITRNTKISKLKYTYQSRKTTGRTTATSSQKNIHSSALTDYPKKTDYTEKVTYVPTTKVALLTEASTPVVEKSNTTLSLVVFSKSTTELLKFVSDEKNDLRNKKELRMPIQNTEVVTETFSVFLRSLMKMLSRTTFAKLSALVAPFTDYAAQLLMEGHMGMLGPQTNTYIIKVILEIKDTPTYALLVNCKEAYEILLDRRNSLDGASNEVLDLMDDLYVEEEEEAMQRVLHEASQFPNTDKKAEDIARSVVDEVLVLPMRRVSRTGGGNYLFQLISTIVRRKNELARSVLEQINRQDQVSYDSNGSENLKMQISGRKGRLKYNHDTIEKYNGNNDRLRSITTFVNKRKRWESSERSKALPNKRHQNYDRFSSQARRNYFSDYGGAKTNDENEDTLTKIQNRYIEINNAKEKYLDEKETPTDPKNNVEGSSEGADQIRGHRLKLDGTKRSYHNNELDFLLPKTNKHKSKSNRHFKGHRHKSNHEKHRHVRDRHGHRNSHCDKRKYRKLKQKCQRLEKLLMKNQTSSSKFSKNIRIAEKKAIEADLNKPNNFTNVIDAEKNQTKADLIEPVLRKAIKTGYNNSDNEIEQHYDSEYSDLIPERGKAKMNVNRLLEDYGDDYDKFKGGQQNVTNNSDVIKPRFRADVINGGGKETDGDLVKTKLHNTIDDDEDNISKASEYRFMNITNVFETTEDTDEEMEVKQNLYDALRHMDFKYPAVRRNLRAQTTSTVNLRKDSDESDVEAVLKNNIYKAVKTMLD